MTNLVQTILIGQDNLTYLIYGEQGDSIVIDPGIAKPIVSILETQKARLSHILVTHHHSDHTNGAGVLKEKYTCRFIGPDSQRITGLEEVLRDNQILRFPDFSIRVVFTPGHSKTSVCYVLESKSEKPTAVFTGDTMFVGGCGRCFEDSPQQMYQSLMKLAALPDDTLIYPGHDYTLENYRFALTVEPNNETVKNYLLKIEEKGALSAIPSTIGLEKQTNPFLRTQNRRIRETLKMPDAPDWKVFAELRKRKDFFELP